MSTVTFLTLTSAELPNAQNVIDQCLDLQSEHIAKADIAAPTSGFLISRFERSELVGLIQDGAQLIYAQDQKGLTAYVLLCSITEFTSLYKNTTEGSYDGTPEHQIDDYYTYLYQIAVRKNEIKSGIGSRILTYALSRFDQPILTDVLISPICNTASCRFFEKNGFQKSGLLTLKKYREFGSLVSQVYVWKR